MIPIHPIVDHFTIALFTIAVLFEIFGWLIKNDTLKAVAWWNLFFATLAAIGSYTTGLLIAGVELCMPLSLDRREGHVFDTCIRVAAVVESICTTCAQESLDGTRCHYYCFRLAPIRYVHDDEDAGSGWHGAIDRWNPHC